MIIPAPLTIAQQMELFKELRFDFDRPRQAVLPDGRRLRQGQIDVVFGGHCFLLADDGTQFTRKASAAFYNLVLLRKIPQL